MLAPWAPTAIATWAAAALATLSGNTDGDTMAGPSSAAVRTICSVAAMAPNAVAITTAVRGPLTSLSAASASA